MPLQEARVVLVKVLEGALVLLHLRLGAVAGVAGQDLVAKDGDLALDIVAHSEPGATHALHRHVRVAVGKDEPLLHLRMQHFQRLHRRAEGLDFPVACLHGRGTRRR